MAATDCCTKHFLCPHLKALSPLLLYELLSITYPFIIPKAVYLIVRKAKIGSQEFAVGNFCGSDAYPTTSIMSTKKRRSSSNEAAKSNTKAHSASPRKKLRFSPTIEVAGKIMSVEAAPRRDRTYKPTSAPLQPIEPHSQQIFFSEGPRLKDHDQGVTSRDHSPNSLPYSLPPHWFDSEPELPHAFPLADGELNFWKTEHAAFIKSAAGLGNAKWIGVRPLGSGGFGTAGLWELRDEDNAVTKVMPTQSPSFSHMAKRDRSKWSSKRVMRSTLKNGQGKGCPRRSK